MSEVHCCKQRIKVEEYAIMGPEGIVGVMRATVCPACRSTHVESIAWTSPSTVKIAEPLPDEKKPAVVIKEAAPITQAARKVTRQEARASHPDLPGLAPVPGVPDAGGEAPQLMASTFKGRVRKVDNTEGSWWMVRAFCVNENLNYNIMIKDLRTADYKGKPLKDQVRTMELKGSIYVHESAVNILKDHMSTRKNMENNSYKNYYDDPDKGYLVKLSFLAENSSMDAYVLIRLARKNNILVPYKPDKLLNGKPAVRNEMYVRVDNIVRLKDIYDASIAEAVREKRFEQPKVPKRI